MKITVIGAVLMVAAAIVVALAIQALTNKRNGGSNEDRQIDRSEE